MWFPWPVSVAGTLFFMAIEVWKDVLYPGRQRDRWGKWFTYTRRDTAAALHNCEKMIRRGWRIPCVWEHQPDAEPQHLSANADRLANYARNTFGEITGAKLDAKGVLWLRHRVEDPKDAAQLLKTKFVSPKVYPSYSDSRRGEYHGATIGHVAATPTPVQFWQQPFELSRTKALYLSYSPGGGIMADENKDETGGTGGGDLKRILAALKSLGINPGDPSTTAELCIGLEAIAAHQGGGNDDEDEIDLDDDDLDNDPDQTADAPAPGTGMGGPPMMMSATRAEPYVKMTRRDLESRVKKLLKTGRIDRPTAIKLIQETQSVSLSFTRSGEMVSNKLVSRIDAYEELPAGQKWKPRSLSATREIDHPTQGTGAGQKSAAERFADSIEAVNKAKK